ncbi:MAG: acetoacetate--CoA ligase, partial [Micromonosporaceae bacterium]|nr:acetoacetate--CoA ligase [Micromonosporaceae bacterium]
MWTEGDGAVTAGTVLWRPPEDVRETSRIGAFLGWLERERGASFADYQALWQWSVSDLPGFWSAIWDYFAVRAQTPATGTLAGTGMPGTRWFPGATLNYAEHVLRAPGLSGDDPAVLGYSQSRRPVTLSVGQLRKQVRRVRAGLRRL